MIATIQPAQIPEQTTLVGYTPSDSGGYLLQIGGKSLTATAVPNKAATTSHIDPSPAEKQAESHTVLAPYQEIVPPVR